MDSEKVGKSEEDSAVQSETGVLASCDVSSKDIDDLNSAFAPKLWLEVLPSSQGTILAAILTNIMTEGLTPEQENILGNFISSLGSLISYKAARDDLSSDTNS
jgi:hypothetical protein